MTNIPRSSAVIMPVFALPGPGCGNVGEPARRFVDFLSAAGQRYWQVLPLQPTGFGDSPYQALCSRAGNPYFIDLAQLAAEDLLRPAELPADDSADVDYGQLYQQRQPLLQLAFSRCGADERQAAKRFAAQNSDWLADCALFFAAKQQFNGAAWTQWPDEALRRHQPDAVSQWRDRLHAAAEFHAWVQYKFDQQWQALRRYATERGVGLIGDLPLYVAADSAELWARRDLFQTDADGLPAAVAGTPPDYFSRDGQLWGNPLYDWQRQAADGFYWWKQRLSAAGRCFDLLRLDHFRGLEAYWAVPAGADSAAAGQWQPGPGWALIDALHSAGNAPPLIAEDLGLLTPEVHQLRDYAGWPGMKVLQFAFDQEGVQDYQPHCYAENCVCYTGTHDNPPLADWLAHAPEQVLQRARRYAGLNADEGELWGLLRLGSASAARLFVAQMQDYLGSGAEQRTNTPGTAAGNWRWRVQPGLLNGQLAQRMRELGQRYGRC